MAHDPLFAQALPLDETPVDVSAWGFRPADGSTVRQTPPSFTWRPQEHAAHYTLQIARDDNFVDIAYQIDHYSWNAHRPSRTLANGRWYWRFRYVDADGSASPWSTARRFDISRDAVALPLPDTDTLLERLPTAHPRLFVRPEQLPELRALARGRLRPIYDQLVDRCDHLSAEPPNATEPPLYPEGIEYGSPPWRKIWWGNRERVEAVLDGAATLGFTWQLGGEERYREHGVTLLMAAAAWDPQGSTGFTYNHEAGMPFLYHFSRAYTFLHDALSGAQRQTCQDIMRVRGEEVYRDYLLEKQHLWHPYSSHANRAWHYLGEAAIAFHGELPEAAQWLDYAMTVYSNVYPVWSDRDGGWHEGMEYFRMYMARFLWWADVMRAAMNIDAFEKPFYAKAGYFPMYMMPPGTEAGGFGDHAERLRTDHRLGEIMTPLAVHTRNGHWQWYAERVGCAKPGSYIDFIRSRHRRIAPLAPTDLPPSRHFRDVGIAAINTTLTDARDNLSVLFKSSPFGSISHGYDAQNSFLVYLYGKRLFIRSGQRDNYGSMHHAGWMWHTKSSNNITVNHESQIRHTADVTGRITAFHDDPVFAYVNGEAGDAYGDNVTRYSRAILVVKPELMIVFDRLRCVEPSTFQWHLHAVNPMRVDTQHCIDVHNSPAAARVDFLWPNHLSITQSNAFDPPLMPGHDLVQHHLTADTDDSAESCVFITVFQYRHNDAPSPAGAMLRRDGDAFVVTAPLSAQRHVETVLHPDAIRAVTAHVREPDGAIGATLDSDAATVDTGE
jgi:hypothetical protein